MEHGFKKYSDRGLMVTFFLNFQDPNKISSV